MARSAHVEKMQSVDDEAPAQSAEKSAAKSLVVRPIGADEAAGGHRSRTPIIRGLKLPEHFGLFAAAYMRPLVPYPLVRVSLSSASIRSSVGDVGHMTGMGQNPNSPSPLARPLSPSADITPSPTPAAWHRTRKPAAWHRSRDAAPTAWRPLLLAHRLRDAAPVGWHRLRESSPAAPGCQRRRRRFCLGVC